MDVFPNFVLGKLLSLFGGKNPTKLNGGENSACTILVPVLGVKQRNRGMNQNSLIDGACRPVFG